MKILFLGQNPSWDPFHKGYTRAFQGTKSGARLLKWIEEAGIPPELCEFGNVVDIPTPGNKRPGRGSFSRNALAYKISKYQAIVVCGKFAEKAVKSTFLLNKPDVLYIEHPSGLNRNLNSKAKVRECIRGIKDLYEVSRARQGKI